MNGKISEVKQPQDQSNSKLSPKTDGKVPAREDELILNCLKLNALKLTTSH